MQRNFIGVACIALAALGITSTGQAIGGPSGDGLFRQRCSMCHSSVAGRQLPLGPNLAGVVGRKAGSANFSYSPALKESGLVWTKANLDRYLAAPGRMVPGTKMVIAVPSGADRSALIDYLATAR